MRPQRKRSPFIALFTTAMWLGVAGLMQACEEETGYEEAAEDTSEAVEDTADELGDATEDAADDIGDRLDDDELGGG